MTAENNTIRHSITPLLELVLKYLEHPDVAESNRLAPFGFYGIRGHYSNGDAEVFIIDRGSDLVPVCSDFTEKN